MAQGLAQGAKEFGTGVAAIIYCQLPDGVGLGRLEKSPEMIFGDGVFGVGDLVLFKSAVVMGVDKEVGNVLLEN